MDKICSLLSTEHGPQIRTTSSCSPSRTSPIATEEAPRESRAASLYGFSTGTIASTPRIAAMAFSRRSASGPMTPMITRDAPRLICASSPNSRTRVTIRWTCSSVAFGCVMTIIFLTGDNENAATGNFLQAEIVLFPTGGRFCRLFSGYSNQCDPVCAWVASPSQGRGEGQDLFRAICDSDAPTLHLSPLPWPRGEAERLHAMWSCRLHHSPKMPNQRMLPPTNLIRDRDRRSD